jgi:excisionase family DNA binding protein
MEDALYRVSRAMKMLDVCRATIYRMVRRGELESVKFGRATRITGASIAKIINAREPLSMPKDGVAPPAARPYGTLAAQVAVPVRAAERNLEKRVAALEREVATLKKLISKLKEAINECT